MTTQTVTDEAAGLPEVTPESSFEDGRHRFTVAVVIGLAVVGIPYLWILWDLWTGTVNPFRQYSPDNFYDLQARAMFAGHLYLPNGAIGIEAFINHGRQYTYFGLFPSLLRMPVLILTHQFDGRLTAPSLLLAWIATGFFSSVLLWRVRLMIRGQAILGRVEAAGYGVLVAAITGGSVLMYLAATPKVSHEDLAWSVALTLGSMFALLGIVERPSGRRVVVCGVLVLAAALDRSPTGYACIFGTLLVSGWLAFGRDGTEQRRWALPTLVAGLVPLVIGCVVNWAKLGVPFGLSEADQVWTQVNAHRRLFLAANGGSAFGLRFLPSTLTAYLEPVGLHFQSAFPFITLPTTPARAVGNVILDQVYPTASVPASMPLLFLLGCWGVVSAFRPHPVGRTNAMRLLLVATASATAAVLLFGYIADRYLADFLPFLALAAMIGMVDVWRRLGASGRPLRIATLGVIAAIGLFGVWANVGAAITPSALWTSTQAKRFVDAQRAISGGAVESLVRQSDRLPYFALAGTLFAVGDCSGLYVSTGFSYNTVPGEQLQHQTWIAVEQGPGINHVLKIIFNRTVTRTDRAVPLMTYGKSALVLVPTGTDQVRMELENPGAPNVPWPAAASGPVRVRPHVTYRLQVMTDPNLHALVVGGLRSGFEHYLAGPGPAVVLTTESSSATPPLVSVADTSKPPPPMTLCRSLLRGIGS
ncbi:MAG: hypothetical protein ACLPR9_07460 [Acidimicrobiales bacterium]